jgi:hypothetical protein
MRHDVKFVQIATWNDFNEGGTIEPVRELTLHPQSPAPGYGYRELETVAEYAGKLKGTQFDPRPIRVAEALYRARKRIEQIRADKLPLSAGITPAALSENLDRARTALLAGDLPTAQSLLQVP